MWIPLWATLKGPFLDFLSFFPPDQCDSSLLSPTINLCSLWKQKHWSQDGDARYEPLFLNNATRGREKKKKKENRKKKEKHAQKNSFSTVLFCFFNSPISLLNKRKQSLGVRETAGWNVATRDLKAVVFSPPAGRRQQQLVNYSSCADRSSGQHAGNKRGSRETKRKETSTNIQQQWLNK